MLCTIVACNYNDEAIFTFMADANINLKASCLDLQKMNPKHYADDNTLEMSFNW